MVVRKGMVGAGGNRCRRIGALTLTRFMTALLFEVRPDDPATFVAVAPVLAVIAVLAWGAPALRYEERLFFQ